MEHKDGIRIDWKPKQMKKISIYGGEKEKPEIQEQDTRVLSKSQT